MNEDLLTLWTLFHQWCQTCLEDGTLELDKEGSGGIRLREWQGDWEASELVVSWSNVAEGVEALRRDIADNCPGAVRFSERYGWRRHGAARRRRERMTALLRQPTGSGAGSTNATAN